MEFYNLQIFLHAKALLSPQNASIISDSYIIIPIMLEIMPV